MTLNSQASFPTFGGSTGGWLRSAEVEEKYAMHRKIKRENSVIKPKPLPVLPKICCSSSQTTKI